jgi:hypothetical protein
MLYSVCVYLCTDYINAFLKLALVPTNVVFVHKLQLGMVVWNLAIKLYKV